MTADRTADRTATRTRLLALAGAAGLLLGASACASAGSTGADAAGGGRLSYEQVRSTAQGLSPNGPCPFGLDLAAALKAAGIDRPVTAGGADAPVTKAELGQGAPASPWPSGVSAPPSMPSIPATPPSAWITCAYTVGTAPVRVDLLATAENGPAIAMMLPFIQRYGNVGFNQLEQFAAEQPTAGQTKVTPGDGTVAAARIAVKGKGDLALTLTQEDGKQPADPALRGEPLRLAAEKLAAQLRP